MLRDQLVERNVPKPLRNHSFADILSYKKFIFQISGKSYRTYIYCTSIYSNSIIPRTFFISLTSSFLTPEAMQISSPLCLSLIQNS